MKTFVEDLLHRVQGSVQKYRMFVPGEKVLVACSGGADSVALFHLLRELALPLGVRLALVHFDHALRLGSAEDFKFVRSLAKTHRAPFYGGRRKQSQRALERGLSPEERARKLRYEFLERVARRTHTKKIALGHHSDDQAETVLMRLIQGTGLRGLQGIRPVVKMNGVTFIRPLIELSRAEIRRFLKCRAIPHQEDITNRSRRFLRNRIRSHLLPLLERKFNPRTRESLCRIAETSVQESAGLDEWIAREARSFVTA